MVKQWCGITPEKYADCVTAIITEEIKQAAVPVQRDNTTKIIVALLGFLGSGTAVAVVSNTIAKNQDKKSEEAFQLYRDDVAKTNREKDTKIQELESRLAKPWYSFGR